MTLTLEHREWLAVQKREPSLDNVRPRDLLARAATLPATLRYTLRGGKVFLIGERRVSLDDLPAEERLEPWTDPSLPSVEQVEAVLDGSGLEWTRRDGSWAVLGQREVIVRAEPGRARLEAVLADWDEIDAVTAVALAEFLLRAQAALCFARCEMSPSQARIVSQARVDALDTDLLDSLRGVTAGCQRLTREVEALLRPAMARLYLAYHGG